jgi:hypothetical protein
MRQTAPNNDWSPWIDFEVVDPSVPAVFQNADGRLEVFAADQNSYLAHM